MQILSKQFCCLCFRVKSSVNHLSFYSHHANNKNLLAKHMFYLYLHILKISMIYCKYRLTIFPLNTLAIPVAGKVMLTMQSVYIHLKFLYQQHRIPHFWLFSSPASHVPSLIFLCQSSNQFQ